MLNGSLKSAGCQVHTAQLPSVSWIAIRSVRYVAAFGAVRCTPNSVIATGTPRVSENVCRAAGTT